MNNEIIKNMILSNKEKSYYEQLWAFAKKKDHKSEENILPGSLAAKLMDKSQLSRSQLKHIWKISCKNPDKIFKNEFFLAMKLIALKQKNLEINIHNINNPIAPPELQGVLIDQRMQSSTPFFNQKQENKQHKPVGPNYHYNLKDSTINRIEHYIGNKCKTKTIGILKKNESRELFELAAKLTAEEQVLLWDLCDRGKKGYLIQGEFILALFFISLKKNRIPIPKILPVNLVKFLQNYKQSSSGIEKKNNREDRETYDHRYGSLVNLMLKKLMDQEYKLDEYDKKNKELLRESEQDLKITQKNLEMIKFIHNVVLDENQDLDKVVKLSNELITTQNKIKNQCELVVESKRGED